MFAIGVEAKRSRVEDDPARLIGALIEIESVAAQAGRELRETLHQINAIPGALALEAVLEAEARLFESAAHRTVRVIRRGTARSLPETHETLICDVVREGLRNAVKHTDSKLMVIHISYEPEEVRVTVQTDGVSDRLRDRVRVPDLAARGEDGAPQRGGLALLRERVGVVRGKLELELGDEGETILRLRLPDAQLGARS
jgi:signal transduction histidine kinase